MFKAGDRVRFIRHDHYPSLVGLVGSVTGCGWKDRNVSKAPAGPGDMVYQVAAETRTLHDVPEAWLEHLGRVHSRARAPGSVMQGARPRSRKMWWQFWM